MTSAAETIIQVRGLNIEIVEGGAGQPLLFLHGLRGPRQPAPFLDSLAEHFRVIAPSHPGFDHSELPESFDSVDDLAFFYLDLLDELNLENVLLMGASFGGWLAAEIAVRSCQRLGRLVLVDPIGIKVGGREDRDIADIFALPPERLAQLMYHEPPPQPDLASMSDEELAIVARNRESGALFIWEPYAHNPKLRTRLHRISVPTLLIWGESDGIVSPAYGKEYRDAIPGARLEIIPEAGHMSPYEQPDEFVRRVLAFAETPQPAGERHR